MNPWPSQLRALALPICMLLVFATQTQADLSVFSSCKLGSGRAKITAECATLAVPLDRNNPGSGSIDLAIARIPSRRQSGNKDAVTMIAGGPGQSALDTWQQISSAFRHVNRDRDIILIDQRGTGKSNRLNCPVSADSLGLHQQFDPAEITRKTSDCLRQLNTDTRFYTTSIAVADLESIREQLGITQWNLYGVSYGTRVALHYLRRYPDAVRTLALDGVVPPQVSLGPEIASMAQRSLDLLFDRCTRDAGCTDAFGHQGEAFEELIDELEQEPKSISYEDFATGKLAQRKFTRNDLAMTIRLMSYSSQTAAILPSMLHEAITADNFSSFARLADMQSRQLDDALATGMHHAIICTEDVPFMAKADGETSEAMSNANSRPDRSYLGNRVVAALKAACKPWPAGIIDPDFKDPVDSDVPTLILSGGADPVTPPEYGSQVQATLTNTHHIINADEGHTQAHLGCIPIIFARFVEQASTDNLQDDCLTRITPLPFFVDANGPLP
ncbi:MAG: alpha/beta fold hydrolase [Granulosicoccus sp.]